MASSLNQNTTKGPALPEPPEQYNRRAQRELNNVLRLYFNRIDQFAQRVLGTSVFSDNAVGIFPTAAGSDPFGRLRVSSNQTLFDSKLTLDAQPLLWDDVEVSGSGTGSTHSTDTASCTLSVADSTAGRRVRQTFLRFNYQPGKGLLVYMSGVLGTGGASITQRMGYGDDDNGIFLECVAGVYYINRRTKTSGVVTDYQVVQSDWNTDTMDGTGVSGTTLDFSKIQVLVIDMAWLGGGKIRVGFLIDGEIQYAHEFAVANTLATVSMTTPNLPLRYELANASVGEATDLVCICATVIAEGGQDELETPRSASLGSSAVTTHGSNPTALIGLRLKAASIEAVVRPLYAQIAVDSSGDSGEWRLYLNPTVAGTFTYADETNSAVQVAKGTSSNTITGGTVLASGLCSNSDGIAEADLQRARYLGASVAGTPDTLVLAYVPNVGGAAAVRAAFNWRETT